MKILVNSFRFQVVFGWFYHYINSLTHIYFNFHVNFNEIKYLCHTNSKQKWNRCEWNLIARICDSEIRNTLESFDAFVSLTQMTHLIHMSQVCCLRQSKSHQQIIPKMLLKLFGNIRINFITVSCCKTPKNVQYVKFVWNAP